MYFGGTGSAAAAVTSGTSAQQNDDITRIGGLTDYIFTRSRPHDGADLHTFCNVVGMVNLLHISGGKTDLVAIGTVSAGCTGHDLSLRKLSL